MQDVLIVIDMQNDFIDGALGTPEAQAIVDSVDSQILRYKKAKKPVLYTMDTHTSNYLDTLEGQKLPIVHCVKGTKGWDLAVNHSNGDVVFEKPTFGSIDLACYVANNYKSSNIELCGVCTDICVLSNATLLRAFNPNQHICINSNLCAGTTPKAHTRALDALQQIQIDAM